MTSDDLSKIQLLAKWFVGPISAMRKKDPEKKFRIPKEDITALINLVHSGEITRNYAEKTILPKLYNLYRKD